MASSEVRLPLIQPNLSFFDERIGEASPEVWDELARGYLEETDLDAFEANVLLGKHRYKEHAKVLAYHRHYYSNQVLSHADCSQDYRALVASAGMPFISAVERFFQRYMSESIGVQLSGGVDSSLIIGCLRRLGIPFALVGFTTNRFEFRTERHVQELLLEGTTGVLLDHEQTLPFSSARDVPVHQVPETASLAHRIEARLADEAKKLGVTLLLSGSGGDLLLGGDASASTCLWKISMFEDPFGQDLIYSPRGLKRISFYSDPEIATAIWHLRRGQEEDLRKCWARHYFKEFLPAELVNFTYKADFWGLRIDGLSQNRENLATLEDEAYELSGLEYFQRKSIKPLLAQPNTECEMEIDQLIEARAAAAAWVVSLKRHFSA